MTISQFSRACPHYDAKVRYINCWYLFVTQRQLMRLFAVKLIWNYEQKCKGLFAVYWEQSALHVHVLIIYIDKFAPFRNQMSVNYN